MSTTYNSPSPGYPPIGIEVSFKITKFNLQAKAAGCEVYD
jgi:hypothetical protein